MTALSYSCDEKVCLRLSNLEVSCRGKALKLNIYILDLKQNSF